jgi:protein phosphatase
VAQVLSSPDETPTAEEILIGFDVAPDPSLPVTGVLDALANWPDLAWEKSVLETAQHPFLPMVLASFTEDGQEYLIEEVPSGRSLWDAWDDSDTTQEQRFVWLKHIAEQLQALHRAGALLESLRPDIVMVSSDGHGRLTDLQELLPLPLTANVTIQGTLYTAPELLACTGSADARANLYSFGAMLYALHVGRELTEMDFDRPGSPKPFIPRFPDSHPLFGRLVMKTFTREPAQRFPSDEASREDATGFTELIRTLAVCSRTLDNVRLEIAAWTTTGMVRTDNEDAFALLHACESRQDDLGEAALVLLADGMGGYEAGEVAAALAIQYLRRTLLQHPLFAPLAGASAFPTEVPRPEGNEPIQLDVEVARKLVQTALKEANRHVFTAARSGVGKRGMGCTAEVVYVNGRHVVVGHVGDSRTYHLHEGQLIQLTRDQTLVNRLVELGTLTAAEAEQHPRRNELQQAIGGQPDVEPGLYHNLMKPGDWIVVCSDGLSNHVKDRELQQMLQSEAVSAEMAARRLVNLANIEGATDNATVVVIRAT